MRAIDYDLAWGSHLPVLMKVMALTKGPVLELGAGLYSTPFLYWLCKDQERRFVSFENDFEWWKMIWNLKNVEKKDGTTIDYSIDELTYACFAWDWGDALIDPKYWIDDKNWDVVLIDHCPSQRRTTEIKLLANNANYIVVHDTQRNAKFCDFESIYPLFKYRFDYRDSIPYTTVLSNFKDLSCLRK